MKKTVILNGQKVKVDYTTEDISQTTYRESYSKEHCGPNELIAICNRTYNINNKSYIVRIEYKSTSRLDRMGWYGQEINYIFKNITYPNDKHLVTALANM